MAEEKDKKRITIEHLLKAHQDGLSIQDIINKTGLARHTVLARLHRLEGEKKVRMRQVNMAKLYYWEEPTIPTPDRPPLEEAHEEAHEETHEETKKDIKLTELKEEHIKHDPTKPRIVPQKPDVEAIKEEVESKVKTGELKKHEGDLLKERAHVQHLKEKPAYLSEDIRWTPKMSVGENTIDKQHQNLLRQIVKLMRSLTKSKDEFKETSISENRQLLHFFHEYVNEHLTYEEKFMEKHKYPKIKEHKKIHQSFIEFFEKFNKNFQAKLYAKPKPGEKSISENLDDLSKECHDFLGNWWTNHILKEDHKYAEFIFKGKIPQTETVTIFEEAEKAKKTEGAKKVEVAEEEREFDIASIKSQIEAELKGKKRPLKELKPGEKRPKGDFIYTGIEGFDALLEKGIPKGAPVLVAGGAGSGKTIFALQTLNYHASQGKKCLYMSFEESEDRLIKHMEDFGWNPRDYIKKGTLLAKRFNPFEITRSVDALLMKAKGELLIDVQPIIFPGGFKPDFVVVDSLTAIASAFTGKEDSYRIYIEQLFRFFEQIGATSFLITETKQVPTIFSTTGVEEFLADGVVVIYNIKRGNIRERAIEVLKLRGAGHQHKIVAMNITSDGMEIFPEQEVFGGLGE